MICVFYSLDRFSSGLLFRMESAKMSVVFVVYFVVYRIVKNDLGTKWRKDKMLIFQRVQGGGEWDEMAFLALQNLYSPVRIWMAPPQENPVESTATGFFHANKKGPFPGLVVYFVVYWLLAFLASAIAEEMTSVVCCCTFSKRCV